MVEVQRFNQPYTHKVRQESIKQILFDVDARDSSGNTCSIQDLSKTTIDLVLRNDLQSNLSTTIFSGSLDDLLSGFYAQTTYLTVVLNQRQDGYKIAIRFDDYPIETSANTYLEIKTNFAQDSFSSLILASSSITVETIPSELPNYNNLVPTIDTYYIGNNSNRFDENIGSDVVGVVAVIDHSMQYDMTANAKIQTCEITAFGGYSKSVSENVLIAENLQMIGSVESYAGITNLVLYRNVNAPLDDARLKASFNAPTLSTQKVLVIRLVQPFA